MLPRHLLHPIIQQYISRQSKVLTTHLPYEDRPNLKRRCNFNSPHQGIVQVAHFAHHADKNKLSLASGFVLHAHDRPEESVILTCAHSLEQIRNSPILDTSSPAARSGSAIIFRSGEETLTRPVSRVLSSLHRSDLLLLSSPTPPLPSLPVSPYPARPDTPIRAHFVTDQQPTDSGWFPWVDGTWSKWVRGHVMGYRDFAGREAEPGTYDALSHLLFTPPPTAGSSGGPIVDEESGAVIGVMLGTRMDNRVEGLRGWGVPSEAIFEMFSLPGFANTS